MRQLENCGESFPGLRKFRLRAAATVYSFPTWAFRIGKMLVKSPVDFDETAVFVPDTPGFMGMSRDKEAEEKRIETLQKKIPKRYRLKHFSGNAGKELRLTNWLVKHVPRYYHKIEVQETRKLYNKKVSQSLNNALDTNILNENAESINEGSPVDNRLPVEQGTPKGSIKYRRKKRTKCTLCTQHCSTFCSVCLVPLHTTLTKNHTRKSCWERFHNCERLRT